MITDRRYISLDQLVWLVVLSWMVSEGCPRCWVYVDGPTSEISAARIRRGISDFIVLLLD